MTVTRGLALFLTVATAGALVNAAAPPGTPRRRPADGHQRRASARKARRSSSRPSEPVRLHDDRGPIR